MLSGYTDTSSDQTIQLKQLVIHLKSELARYKERVKELENNSGINEIISENRYLLKELESAQESARIAEEREEHFKREIQRLENKNQMLIVEMETLRQKLNQSEKKTEHLNVLREELEEKNETLYHAIKQEITEELNEQIESLKETLTSLLENSTPPTSEWRNAIAEAREEFNQLTQSLLEKQQMTDKEKILALSPLQETAEKIAGQMELFSKQAEKQKAKTENLEKSFEQLTKMLLPLQDSIEKIGNEICELKNKPFPLNEGTINSELAKALSPLQANVEKLAEKMAVFSKQSEEQKSKTEHLQTNLGQLTEMLGSFRNNIQALEKSISELQDKQNNELTLLKTEIEEYKQTEKEWQTEIHDIIQILGGFFGQKSGEHDDSIIPEESETPSSKERHELLDQLKKLKTRLMDELEQLNQATPNKNRRMIKNAETGKLNERQSGKIKEYAQVKTVRIAPADSCKEHRWKAKRQTKVQTKTDEILSSRKMSGQQSRQSKTTVTSFRFSRPQEPVANSRFKPSTPSAKIISINSGQRTKSREKSIKLREHENEKKTNSLRIFYEKNPLYNHPEIQKYSINPFK